MTIINNFHAFFSFFSFDFSLLDPDPLPPKKKAVAVAPYATSQLQHVACSAVSLILKSKRNLECCVLAVQCLISILKFDPIFKDVFREVGKLG